MEQSREEAKQQQKQPQIPLKCPRCGSLDTIFRYFNNNSLTQPRRHCRTCKRQWTVGGKLRHIPTGGNARIGKPTKASSSRGDSSRSQPTQPQLSLEEGHKQHLTVMTAMASQNFDTTLFQPMTNMPAAVSPQNYFSDQISCLDATHTLIQQVDNQHLSARNIFSSAGTGTNMIIPQEQNVQTMAPQQALSQQNSIISKPYQIYTDATNAPPSHSHNNGVVQPAWPINLLPQDITYDSSFTMSNASLQSNFSVGIIDTEDTTDVNVDEWLNFSESDPP